MDRIQQGFDYDALDRETAVFTEGHARAIHKIARVTGAGIVQIGQLLTEVKERLREHNKGRSRQDQERLGFLEWIRLEFGWTERSAQRFMAVRQHVKCDNLSDLAIDVSALYLIAAPKTPEPVRQEAVRLAISGEHVSHGAVKEVIARYNQSGDADVAVGELFRAVANVRREAAAVLPSPAEARRVAIETGAHTLDRTGTYQPPVTHEEQAQYRADMTLTDPAFRFCRWVNSGEVSSESAAEIIQKRQWTQYYRGITRAIEWLTELREQLQWQEARK